jgi:hypothetical protein
MHLLLTAALLLQDKGAEETFKKIEEHHFNHALV